MIALGSDHGGYLYKEELKKHLEAKESNISISEPTAPLPAIIPFMQKKFAELSSPANVKKESLFAEPESE